MAGTGHSGGGERVDAVVVGAGFAGLYAAHRLTGLGLRVRGFEAGDGVGGTWYWNRYPGARCDIESLEYSYQFSEELAREWEWSERYAGQPEILAYLEHVADRFDLRRHFRFGHRVIAARYDEDSGGWTVATDAGARARGSFLVLATGCLSRPNLPAIPGLESFAGPCHHTGLWPKDGVDLRGLRVGVLGTGSSAVQAVPILAEEAERVVVFQRTPTYSVPARNRPLDPEEQRRIKADYRGFRLRNWRMPFGAFADQQPRGGSALAATPEERRRRYDTWWEKGGLPFLAAYDDLLVSPEANRTAADYIRDRIREIVRKPARAEALLPEQMVGCKRLCIDSGYYEAWNRENVDLVDLRRDPIEGVEAAGVRTRSGRFDLDLLVLATGFDAMTGAALAIDLRGRDGRPLREKWSAGPRTYLGLCTAGFPNLFLVTGPGSPSVLANMVPAIEQHVNWIADCIRHLGERGLGRIEARREAEDAWVEHVNQVASFTVFPTCNSWYLGANVPGKPRVFMPYIGFDTYVDRCDEVAAKGYEGFELRR